MFETAHMPSYDDDTITTKINNCFQSYLRVAFSTAE
jgi:hypothetical protein